MTHDLMDWLDQPSAALGALLADRRPVDPEELDGHAFDGVALLPAWARRLSWTRFQKRFSRRRGHLVGWNVRVHQDPPGTRWRPKTRGHRDVAWGPFVVRPPEPGEDGSLVLDYGRLVDPLVAVDDSASVLLGITDVRVFGARIRTPTWFVLQRSGSAGAIPALGWHRADGDRTA